MAAKICLVTGASSGIGHATALELLRAGHVVYGAARRVEIMAPIEAAGGRALPMDVSKEADLERVVHTILDEQGRIDVLVNNAGIGLHGSVEEVPMEQARHQLEVNLFAPIRLVQLVLPHLREQRGGTIVNVSSIGGEIALPLGAWYYGSKHALEAVTDSLRQEVKRFGVEVVLVQPGLIRTGFEDDTPRELRALSGNGPYGDVANAMATKAEGMKGSPKISDPRLVANVIRDAIESTNPKPRYVVGYLARTLLTLNRLLSDRAWDKLVTR